MKFTSQQLRDFYIKLPEELQNAISATETTDLIFEIGKKYDLLLDQQQKLQDETTDVLIGVADPSQFISTLSTELNIDRTKANNIVAEINAKIFVPVKEHLKGLYDKNSSAVPKKVEQPTSTREDLLKNIENPERMNLSQSAFDRLKGIQTAPERKIGDVSGLSAIKPPVISANATSPTPAPTTNQTNPSILDEKMRVATNIPKSVNDNPYIKGDPYRE